MIRSLDHINIRVRDLARTRDFYRTVLGMESGPVPGMPQQAPEAWIYDTDGRAVLHVGTADLSASTGRSASSVRPDAPAGGSGSIHHVAFDCLNYQSVCEAIDRSGLSKQCNDIAAAGLRQIFIQDPDGILIELNFRHEAIPATA